MNKINLFLAHTPLQLISAVNTINQYFSAEKNILIYEGDELSYLVKQFSLQEVCAGKQTRTVTHKPARGIRFNLRILDSILKKHTPSDVHLFVSELQWMCNKAFFSRLQARYKNNFRCSFFDEGLHIYANNTDFSEETPFKTILKWTWMRFNALPTTRLFTKQFYTRNKIDTIYCYHPHLMKQALYPNTQIKSLDPLYLNDHKTKKQSQSSVNNSKLLLLSQAYYWDIPEAYYKAIMIDLVAYFKKRDIKEFYMKPHHSDKKEWIDTMQNELGFHLVSLSKDIPIELDAKNLDYDYIVSVSSSALLNLQTFGFSGKLVSFGAKRCSLTKKFIEIHKLVLPLFYANNVDVVD